MLKTTLASGLEDKKLEQGDQGIQVDDWDKKEPIQKSCKGQQTAKSKKWIYASLFELRI